MKFIDLKGEWKVVTDSSESFDLWPENEWDKNKNVIMIPDSINHSRIGIVNHDIHTDHLIYSITDFLGIFRRHSLNHMKYIKCHCKFTRDSLTKQGFNSYGNKTALEVPQPLRISQIKL